MEQIPQYADERLTAEMQGACLYCERSLGEGGGLAVDHAPSKALLRKPYPENLPTVASCAECNNGFSGDEQYVRVFLACVFVGSADPAAQTDKSVQSALTRDARLRAEMVAAMRETLPGEPMMWEPDQKRLSTVLVKNARGHLWYEHADHRPESPTTVSYMALESLTDDRRQAFENPSDVNIEVLPEVGSRALQRMFSGDAFDGWTYVQDDFYRFAIHHLDGNSVRVRSVISEYLATEVLWTEEY